VSVFVRSRHTLKAKSGHIQEASQIIHISHNRSISHSVITQHKSSLGSRQETLKYVYHAVSHKTSSSGQRAGGPLTGVTARGGRFQTFRWQELLDPPPMEDPGQEVNAVRLRSLLLSLSLSLSLPRLLLSEHEEGSD